MLPSNNAYATPSLGDDEDNKDDYTRPLLDRREEQTQPSHPITVSRAPDAEPATGVVYGQPMDGFGYPTAHVPSPIMHVPVLPDGVRMWKELKLWMACWFGLSILTLFIFFPLFVGLFVVLFPVKVALILSAVASGIYLRKSYMDLGKQVRFVAVVGQVAAGLDSFGLIITTLILLTMTNPDNDPDFGYLYTYFVFFTVFLATHCWLSFSMATRARSIEVLLNPVSSGIVSLSHAVV